MKALFQKHRTRMSHSPRTRRTRPTAACVTPERLEPRLALAGDTTFYRPPLEPARTLVMDSSMGPNPVVMSKSQVVGTDVKSFVISHVPEGSVVEKWDAVKQQWVDVSTMPKSSNPQELMRLLSNRYIKEGDKIQWRPKAGVAAAAQQAFQIIGWDDGTDVVPPLGNRPNNVENLIVQTTDQPGELAVEWDWGPDGSNSSYGVRITSELGSRTYSTKNKSLTLQNIAAGIEQKIEVWATDENGTSDIATVKAALPDLRPGTRIDPFWDLNQHLLPQDPVDQLGSPLVPVNSSWGNSVGFPGVSYDAIMAATETAPAEVPHLLLPNEIITGANVDDGFAVSMWVQARGPGMLLSGDYAATSGGDVTTLPYLWIESTGKVHAGLYGPTSGLPVNSSNSVFSWTDPVGENQIGSPQSIESLATVIDGSWHQITFVVKGSKQALYIDGLLQGENYATVYQQVDCLEDSWELVEGDWVYSVPLPTQPLQKLGSSSSLSLAVFQGQETTPESAGATNTYVGTGLVPVAVSSTSSETHSSSFTPKPTNLVSGDIYTTISSAKILSTSAGYSLQLTASTKPLSTMPITLAINYLPSANSSDSPSSSSSASPPSSSSASPPAGSSDSPQANSAFSFNPPASGAELQSVKVGESIFSFVDGNPAPQTNYPQPYRGAIAELAAWSTNLTSADVQAITTAPINDVIAGQSVFPDGSTIAAVPTPAFLYTFEGDGGNSVPNVGATSSGGAATTVGLTDGSQATIPVPFADIPRLPNYQPFGLGLMAPLASGRFDVQPPDSNDAIKKTEWQVALAKGDQLTLQRSNINTAPVLALSITDDLGQTLLQNAPFQSPGASDDDVYTLTAPRTGSYKLTLDWAIGSNGHNSGNFQPIVVDYSMTPGDQNSFQNLFVTFRSLYEPNGSDILATYSSPLIPSVNELSNDNVAPDEATGPANYFPLWADTRYFPQSPNYTTVDLSNAFVQLQSEVGYSIADLNGAVAAQSPTELQNNLATAYSTLSSSPPSGLNLQALDAVNSFFVKVNTYREAVYDALNSVWEAFESLPDSIDTATGIANTISSNQQKFVVDENAGPPNINPAPKNFGKLFGDSVLKMAVRIGGKSLFKFGGPVGKGVAATALLGSMAYSASKKAGKGITTQNSVLVNLLPVMNSQLTYEQLTELGSSIDQNVLNALSFQESQLKSPPYLNSIYSNFGLMELMSGMSADIYSTSEAQSSFIESAETLAAQQAWSQMVPDVFKWAPVAPDNLPVNNYNFAQLPFYEVGPSAVQSSGTSVSWKKATPNIPSGSANDATWLATGDLNGDFYPDIVTSNNGSSSISVLLAQPSPQWNAATPAVGYNAANPGWTYTNVYGESSTLSTDATDPSGIAVADFDGDGQNEVLVGSISNSSLYVIEVETTSTSIAFGAQTEIDLNGGEQPQQVTVADFNQDGKPDFVTACQGTNNLVYGLNQFAENPGTPFQVSSPGDMAANNNVRWVTAGDLTGDGFPDLVSLSYEKGGINTIYAEVWVNKGVTGDTFNGFANPSGSTNTTFTIKSSLLVSKGNSFATNPVIGDLDGDGYKDDFAFGMNVKPQGGTQIGQVQFVYGDSSGPTNWESQIGTSGDIYGSYVSVGYNGLSNSFINSLAVLPSDQLPGVGSDVVIASYGNLGQWFFNPPNASGNTEVGLAFMYAGNSPLYTYGSTPSGSGNGILPSSASATNSQIVVDLDTGLIAAVSGSPATVAYTTVQVAGVTDSTVALMGTDYAGLNETAFNGRSFPAGTGDSVELNLEVQVLLQQLQSGKFINAGPRESAGVGAPGFFVAAVDVTGNYYPDEPTFSVGNDYTTPIPPGSMAFASWNLIDENGNPIALETLYQLVGNISPAQQDSEVVPAIRPNSWQAQDLNPIDPLQPAMAYNGGWFAAVEPFNNAPATYSEMFFEWGAGVSGYAPNSLVGPVTYQEISYSSAALSPARFTNSSAPQNLTATPTNPNDLSVSWSRPKDVYGGSATVVTYVVTLTQNGVDFSPVTTTDLTATFEGLLEGSPYTVTVQPQTSYGDGESATLTQTYPIS